MAQPQRKVHGKAGPLGSGLDLVIRRMQGFGTLSAAERDVISACGGPRDHASGAVILDEGQRLAPLLFVAGWACRSRILPDGRRQIVNFILPGDGIGLEDLPDRKARPV